MGVCLYLFLDEGGNFDFSVNGTRYYTATALVKRRPFSAYKDLEELKYDLVEAGCNIEYFHASEDRQHIRDKVFAVIKKYFNDIRLYSVVTDKQALLPEFKSEDVLFYRSVSQAIQHALGNEDLDGCERVIIFTDNIPLRKTRNLTEKAIKQTVKSLLPEGVKYSIMHHSSRSNKYLQIVDYCNWAILRKWERADIRSYELIKDIVRCEAEGL